MPEFERTVILPSQGQFYGNFLPGGEVKIRSLTTQEEKLLASPQSSIIKMLETIFTRCSNLPKDFPPSKLYTTDRFSLLFHLRSVSYGPTYQINYNCSSCGSLNTEEIDIEKDVLGREEKLPPDSEAEIDVDLPVSGKRVSWRYPTGEDELALDKQRARINRGQADITEMRVARQITKIDGMPEPDLLKLMDFVRSLVVRDSLAIRDSMRDHSFGVDNLEFDFTCKNISCGAQQPPMILPVSEDFFRVLSPRS